MGTTIKNSAAWGNYAEMSNGTWCRSVTIPSNWSKLRLGVLLGSSDLGDTPSGTPRFGLGLCSGTTNILGDATTTHFVGVLTDSASWNRWTSTGPVYYSITVKPFKKVGTTETFGTALTSDIRIPYTLGAVADRYLYVIEITKGSPNYSFKIFGIIGNNPQTDYTKTQFLTQLEAAGDMTLIQHAYSGAQTLAVDEGTDGTLNAINLWWDKAAFTMQVSAVGIAQLS